MVTADFEKNNNQQDAKLELHTGAASKTEVIVLCTTCYALLCSRKQAYTHLTNVEVREFGFFMSHICTEISTNHAVPRGRIHGFKTFSDSLRNFLLSVVISDGVLSNLDGLFLHVYRHQGCLNNRSRRGAMNGAVTSKTDEEVKKCP
eukprot:CAMPEP_0194590124 /NCGR_PEP_ID=MMETSP0292-20121207/21116_1 /TAXON_ID=39354 /ORGANISM="Heterosigma akashiwo, Strain CCMP2393" /LENGTH=146 /DNA_ID=CAMNT_0039447613 /DNA_START=69 /DNA_END=507 /DNA_ORIENTATION=+